MILLKHTKKLKNKHNFRNSGTPHRNNKNDEAIKRGRTESILKEIIPEILDSLGDSKLHGLYVTEVVCSRGRSDAKVFLDKTFIEESEEASILSALSKARKFIERQIINEQGWFKSPKLTFEFDKHSEYEKRIEELFDEISKK